MSNTAQVVGQARVTTDDEQVQQVGCRDIKSYTPCLKKVYIILGITLQIYTVL